MKRKLLLAAVLVLAGVILWRVLPAGGPSRGNLSMKSDTAENLSKDMASSRRDTAS